MFLVKLVAISAGTGVAVTAIATGKSMTSKYP
jgi:hypothetical protein